MADDFIRFEKLTYDSFKELARDESLSPSEKIGFPRAYREGYEKAIFKDIKSKLPALNEKRRIILDIGPGCSRLPFMLIEHCRKNKHRLLLADSEEMLSHVKDRPSIEKYPGRFPECGSLCDRYKEKIDCILMYSVLQHVFLDTLNPFSVIDRALTLLNEGGRLLVGDIPNISKRKRYFCSRKGIVAHKKFTGRDIAPVVKFMKLEEGKIDDGVLFSILHRYRNSGFETYLLPQGEGLPLSNRREDILIVRR